LVLVGPRSRWAQRLQPLQPCG